MEQENTAKAPGRAGATGRRHTGKKILCALSALLVLLLAGFLITCHQCLPLIWDNLTVGRLPDPKSGPWEGGTAYSHIPYANGSDAQYLDLYVPDAQNPPALFVLIHGGGFVAGDADTRQVRFMIDFFRDHGYACASVNYRLAQEAPFPAAIEDCKAAIRFLRAHAQEYGYSAEHLALFGESAGGYLALMCSVTTEEEFSSLPFIGEEAEGEKIGSMPDVLVAYYPHVSPLTGETLKSIGVPGWLYLLANNWMIGHTGGFEEFESYWIRKNYSELTGEEKAQVDPLAYLEKNAASLAGLSVYLIHGDADLTVPYPSSVRLKEALDENLGEEKTLFRTDPHMGHASDPMYREEILDEIDGYIREHLAVAEGAQ